MRQLTVLGNLAQPGLQSTLSRIALVVLVTVIGAASVAVSAPGSTIALWWPAAGIGAIALLGCPRRAAVPTLLALLVANTCASLLGGRNFEGSLILGIGNAFELVVLVTLLGGRTLRMDITMRDAIRFVLSAAAAASVFGLTAVLNGAVQTGALSPQVGLSGTASHFSALLVIVPVAMMPVRWLQRGQRREFLVQFVALLTTIALVFSPDNSFPLAYIPLPVLIWAALRFPSFVVALELLVLAILSVGLSALGGGPFVAPGFDPRMSALLIEIYLIVYAGSMFVLVGLKSERESEMAQQAVQDNLLREAMTDAQRGFVIVAPSDDGVGLRGNADGLRLYDLLRTSRPDVLGHGDVPEASRDVECALEVDGVHRTFRISTTWHGAPTAPVATLLFADITLEAQRSAGLRELLEKERSLAASLRELDRQKDDFISTVSHELRTPVTSILGYAVELEDSGLGTQEHNFAEAITRNAERLALRIEELLAAGPVNKPNKATEPCDVAATCAGIIEDLVSSRTTRGVKLSLSRPPDPAWVLADPDSLLRIITNLVTNSLKFSPTDGSVRLSVERDDDGGLVTVKVTDEGPGIQPENLELVFTRFYREPTALSANTPGTGLGLPIARTLAQGMHGSLVLESDGASGTTAVLTLPSYRITAQGHGLVPGVEGIRG